MSATPRRGILRIAGPMAALLGTILAVYSLRFLVYAPFAGTPAEWSARTVTLAFVGFVLGALLLVAGLRELDLLSP